MPNFSTPKEAALTAAFLGFPVIPCNPENKKPLFAGWPEKATTDRDTITEWWSQWPQAMIGVLTGKPSGYFVLDIDVKDGVPALEKLSKLETLHGSLVPLMTVRTPSEGLHLYLPMPEGTDIRNSAGKIGIGIDIRGTGGYVIFPGSTRADGKQYTLISKETN
jgi:Bifunctional DNA primase/polymerase, N-terminal